MRIVQLITQDRGGPVDHVFDLAPELVELGHEVWIIGPPGLDARLAALPGVRWRTCAVRSARDLRGVRGLMALLRELRPDVVHCQDRRAGLYGRLGARYLGIPNVYTLHGAPDSLAQLVPGNRQVEPERRADRFIYLGVERYLAKLSRGRVVVASEALRAYAEQAIKLDPQIVDVVPNGIKPGRFWDDDSEGAVSAVWLGLMVPVKRVDLLVRAIADVPGVRLELVGDGPLRGETEDLVRDLGVLERIRFCGYQDDPAPWLAAADIAVLTSDAENCPLSVIQAMSAGCAIVATSVGGVPELVRHGSDGLLVPPGSVDELAAAVRSLQHDPELRRSMGQSARLRAGEFDSATMARRLEAVYTAVPPLPGKGRTT